MMTENKLREISPYRYLEINSKNGIEKSLPGGDWEYMCDKMSIAGDVILYTRAKLRTFSDDTPKVVIKYYMNIIDFFYKLYYLSDVLTL